MRSQDSIAEGPVQFEDIVNGKLDAFQTAIAKDGLANPAVSWAEITSRVFERETVVKLVKDSLEHGGGVSQLVSYEIASTDIFVQKAESELKGRSNKMRIYAAISIVVSFFTIALYILLTTRTSMVQLNTANNLLFIGSVIRSVVITGLFLGVIYLLVALFRAFLHEWTTLENRAHSLRLGRLYIYLKYVSVTNARDASRVRKELTASDLERVFGWNIETSTAFKDIRPELVSRNLVSQLADSLGKAFAVRNRA